MGGGASVTFTVTSREEARVIVTSQRDSFSELVASVDGITRIVREFVGPGAAEANEYWDWVLKGNYSESSRREFRNQMNGCFRLIDTAVWPGVSGDKVQKCLRTNQMILNTADDGLRVPIGILKGIGVTGL